MMPSNFNVSGANVSLAQMSCGAKGRKTGANGYLPLQLASTSRVTANTMNINKLNFVVYTT